MSRQYSEAVRRAAHHLYQFVLARVLEEVPVTAVDVEAHLLLLGVAPADIGDVYNAAMVEASYWYHEPSPPTADELWELGAQVDIWTAHDHILDAAEIALEREIKLAEAG